jgi:hypothetical protein
MLIKRVLAGCGWLSLSFTGSCVGIAVGTGLALAASGEDGTYCLLGGCCAGLLALAIPAAVLEWSYWAGPARSIRIWRRSALAK